MTEFSPYLRYQVWRHHYFRCFGESLAIPRLHPRPVIPGWLS